MTKKVLLLSFLTLLLGQFGTAQHAYCGYQKANNQLANQFPTYQKAVQQTFNEAKRIAKTATKRNADDLLQVQVVVHVVHNTEVQNIPDELIHEQIAILNEDFQYLNPDRANAREEFKAIAGNAGIEFVLATEDPDGNPTSGITRTQTDVETFIDLDLDLTTILEASAECGLDFTCIQEKILVGGLEGNAESGGVQMDDVKSSAKGGIDPWDTDRYINIWVTNLNIDFLGQQMPAILGFAYPPVGAPNWPDEVFEADLSAIAGVVVHHEAFGKSNAGDGLIGNLAEGGRTTTHEMGHYFGLRHVHGDGDCDSDDGISDTPSADASQQAQADPNNLPVCEDLYSIDTCPEDDMPDMVENYMDYNAITCQNLFTQEQVDIMRAMLQGPRAGLLGQMSTSTAGEIAATQGFKVYPNPTKDILNLTLEGYNITDFEVRVQNILGATVSAKVANGNTQIDMSQLDGGVYLVNLISENLQITKKVSVVR
ncbi:MAG: zinc-dependent metalloprotease [Bacteroidota bacterium]